MERRDLIKKMQALSEQLCDPNLTPEQLDAYYGELREINKALSRKDAERREIFERTGIWHIGGSA